MVVKRACNHWLGLLGAAAIILSSTHVSSFSSSECIEQFFAGGDCDENNNRAECGTFCHLRASSFCMLGTLAKKCRPSNVHRSPSFHSRIFTANGMWSPSVLHGAPDASGEPNFRG